MNGVLNDGRLLSLFIYLVKQNTNLLIIRGVRRESGSKWEIQDNHKDLWKKLVEKISGKN